MTTLADLSWQPWRWQQKSPLSPWPGDKSCQETEGSDQGWRPGRQPAPTRVANAAGGESGENITLTTKASRNVKGGGHCGSTGDGSERIQRGLPGREETRKNPGEIRMKNFFKFREEVDERGAWRQEKVV